MTQQWLTFWVLPALYVLFLWWFSSGLIMAFYGRSARVVRLGFGGFTLAAFGAVVGLILTSQRTDPAGIYLAFTCGTIIWAWLLSSYYFGFVTGPIARTNQPLEGLAPAYGHRGEMNRTRQLGLVQRFGLALRSMLYHELLALSVIGGIAALTWSAPNRYGFWTVLVLWVMHSSGKLNVFLGVRNFRIEFLPEHLHFLDGLLFKEKVNAFFPVSVGVAFTVVGLLFYRAAMIGALTHESTGLLLVGFMMLFGVLEHWLLVLPLPAALWGWGVRPLPPPSPEIEVS